MESGNNAFTCCVLDTETGGLTPKTCAITQLSCKIIRLDTYDIVGVFDKYIKPYPKQGELSLAKPKRLRTKREIEQEEEKQGGFFEYQERALQVTGLSFEFLEKNGEDIHDVASSFVDFVKRASGKAIKSRKPFLVGQNILFDVGFLQHMFIYTGLLKEFYSLFQFVEDINGNYMPLCLDTMLLSRAVFANDPTMTSFNLEAITKKLAIELVDAHSSMADVDATGDAFVTYINRMRNGTGGEDGDFLKTAEKYREHFMI